MWRLYLVVVALASSISTTRAEILYDGLEGQSGAFFNQAPTHLWWVDPEVEKYVAIASPLKYEGYVIGCRGVFSSLSNNLSSEQVLGWWHLWATAEDFAQGAQPQWLLGIHPKEWTLLPELTTEDGWSLYEGEWVFPVPFRVQGDAWVGGTIWSETTGQTMGVAINQTASLPASILTSDYLSQEYISLNGAVPAWCFLGENFVVPEPSSFSMASALVVWFVLSFRRR